MSSISHALVQKLSLRVCVNANVVDTIVARLNAELEAERRLRNVEAAPMGKRAKMEYVDAGFFSVTPAAVILACPARSHSFSMVMGVPACCHVLILNWRFSVTSVVITANGRQLADGLELADRSALPLALLALPMKIAALANAVRVAPVSLRQAVISVTAVTRTAKPHTLVGLVPAAMAIFLAVTRVIRIPTVASCSAKLFYASKHQNIGNNQKYCKQEKWKIQC